jgi:Family of unknown function (DUF5681)
MSDDEKNENATSGNGEAANGGQSQYKVGYRNPPLNTRFKPGQSGNPKGRRADRPNIQTMTEQIIYHKVPVREGGETRWMPLYQAVLYAQGVKGAKGDARSASVYFNETNPHLENFNSGRQSANMGLSDKLFEGVDSELLSADDKIDLARIAEIIDLGGDITALKVDDFARLQQILNKGRGKDITLYE